VEDDIRGRGTHDIPLRSESRVGLGMAFGPSRAILAAQSLDPLNHVICDGVVSESLRAVEIPPLALVTYWMLYISGALIQHFV
jgi:hypothetical protein